MSDGVDDSKRGIAWTAILSAVIGGLIGGGSAIVVSERTSRAEESNATTELRREVLDAYAMAYSDAVSKAGGVNREARAIADGHTEWDASILSTEGFWNPSGLRLAAGSFKEMRALDAASNRMRVIFSEEVVECVNKIDTSFTVAFWEFSNLAEHGTYEWFDNNDVEPVGQDLNLFAGVLGVVRGNLYDRLIALARVEADLDSGQNGIGDCEQLPTHISNSSTLCAGSTDCFDFTMENLEAARSGNWEFVSGFAD
ncbi:hypothetical protein [Isoptericola jiangsuensis]|nr:hypothetical protein [Isoptericola jiangsuensis]